MATRSEIEKMLGILQGTSSVLQVLNINPKEIIRNYVEQAFDRLLSKYEIGSAEYNSMLENLITYFVTGQGKQFMKQNLDALGVAFSSLKSMLDNIQESFMQLATLSAIPSVITTGSAASAPNPGYSVIDNIQRVQALKATIKVCSDKASQFLNLVLLLQMEALLPSEALDIINVLGAVNQLLNSI